MQKRIFALWGASSVGKTTTLRFIAREIMRSFFGAQANIELEPLPKEDITVIITISSMRIGITSQGDPGRGLFERLQTLVDANCAIIFCATRTSGETVREVEEIEKENNYRATWVTNYQSGFEEERAKLNQKSAEHIVQLMRNMCEI